MSTPAVIRRATVLGIALLGAASGASAQTLPLALVSPTTPAAITFSKSVAPLTVVVANNTDHRQTLVVKYVGSAAPASGLQAAKTAAATGFSLVVVGGGAVAAHDATALRLEFHRVGENPTIDGAVVISADKSAVAVPVSESRTSAIAGFEQKSASVTATTWVGPVSRVCRVLGIGGTCPGDHYQSSSTAVAARGVLAHETLIGGGSENATVAIKTNPRGVTAWRQQSKPKRASKEAPAAQPAPPPTRADITAIGIPNPGTYSGDVALNRAVAEPKTIAVTVHARDAIIWPLLALGLGLLLSWYLTKRREQKRAGQGLRTALQDAIDPYLDRRARRERRRPDRDYLDHLFIRSGSGLARRDQQYADPRQMKTQPEEAVPALYWDTYKLDDADKRAGVTKGVATMVARFGRWVRLDDAFTVLAKAAEKLPKNQPIYNDAQSVLDLAQGEPVDDDEAQARAAAMTTWATICELFHQVAGRFDRAAAECPPPWADEHQNLDGKTIYAHFAPVETPEKVAAFRLALLRARRLLVDAPNAPKDKPQVTVVENLREATADLEGDVFVDDLLGGGIFSNLLGPFRHRFESAADIRRNVREWDWIVFLTIAFLTTLAYTLGFYSGKDWGSLTDYVTAIVAGATVPTVINWALLPSSRPLTSASATTSAS